MKRQNRYHFYCSSLLIVYDGELLNDGTCKHYFSRLNIKGNPCRHFITKAMNNIDKNNMNYYSDNEIEENYKQYLKTHSTCFIPLSTNANDLVQVKIIDLAHTILLSEKQNNDIDIGYIHGLETLINMLEEIITNIDNNQNNIYDNIVHMFASESLYNIKPV